MPLLRVISCKQRHGAQHLAVPFPDELRLIGNGKALPAYDRIFNAVARADQRPKPAGFSVIVFISVHSRGFLMTTLLQDMRYGLRLLWKSPGFTIVAMLSLALGVGANTAIFSIVNAVLLRSLPFSHPDRLVKIVANNRGVGAQDIGLSVPELDDLRTRAGVFDQVSVTWPTDTNLTGAERPQRLEAQGVSPNYFSMLGTSAHIGRVFGPGDEAQGFAEAVVISDSLWARGFGRDPGILGRKVQLDNDPYTIVGVLPPGFRHPGSTLATDVEIWMTAGFKADPFPKPDRSLRVLPGAIGLLKPGISREQAQSRLDAFASQLRAEYATDYPAGSGWSIEVEPLQESLVGNVRPMLLVLMGAVVLIILLASVNVANLLLARASGKTTRDGRTAGHGSNPLAHDSAVAHRVDDSVSGLRHGRCPDRNGSFAFCAVSTGPNSPAGRGAGGLDSAGFRLAGFPACRAGVSDWFRPFNLRRPKLQ